MAIKVVFHELPPTTPNEPDPALWRGRGYFHSLPPPPKRDFSSKTPDFSEPEKFFWQFFPLVSLAENFHPTHTPPLWGDVIAESIYILIGVG